MPKAPTPGYWRETALDLRALAMVVMDQHAKQALETLADECERFARKTENLVEGAAD